MGSAGAEDKMSASQSLLQKTGQTQAAFVPKLFIMVKNMKQPTPEDPNPKQPLISWSKTGDVFCVYDPIEFSRVILPLHFKHNNWQSFVRQLNMYGFHKVNDLLSSSHSQTESIKAWEFQHPHFKRDRPDLLPMIKRKSTKHHGASKPSSSSNNASSAINPQATKQQVGETHPQRHIIPPSDGVPGRAGPRAIQPYSHHHHHHTSRVLPSSAHYDSPHQAKQPPPPPPFIHTAKANNNLTNPPPRPPALYPILTHQFQYTHSTHSQLKSSPLTTHSNTKGSPTTRANPQSVITCSPSSGYHPTSTGRPITSQSQQSVRCNLEEEEVTERSFAWSSVRETCSRSDPSLSRIEDELRRLNHTLAHRDPSGDHIFSVLGLIVELVMLLADQQHVKVGPTQHEKLARYVHSAKEALGKLEASNFCSHESVRRCSGAPSTDSVSPVSTDPLENNMRSKLNSADSNFPKTTTTTTTTPDGPSSAGWTARPRWPDRMLSSQSLPPLNTLMMAQGAPPPYNRTHSSGALPNSINRLMNADTEEHRKVAVNSEEYQEEESQEEAEDEEEEGEGEGEESDSLDDVSYADEHEETDDDDVHEATRAHDEGNYGVVPGHGEPHSAADQHSFSDQLSSSSGRSTPERAAEGPDVAPEQRGHSPGEMDHITYPKRPYHNDNGDVTNGPGPALAAHDTSNTPTALHHSDGAHRYRKRPRAGEPRDLSPA